MTTGITNAEKISRLPWSVASSAANGFAAPWTFFGPSFVLLVTELGASKAGVGFLLSLFPFAGLLALVAAPAAARFGYKRTYLFFWAVRYVFAAGLLLLPWLRPVAGPAALSTYIALLVLGFAVCRAIGETGYYPWQQEFVPDTIRGKYYAAYYGFSTVASFVAVLIASYVIARGMGLDRYLVLVAGGVVFGAISVWLAARVPGGAPQPAASGKGSQALGQARALRAAFNDSGFRRYLVAAGLVVLGYAPLGSFLPLLVTDRIRLASGLAVLIQAGLLLGGFVAGFVWGWLADRYGSKPVIISSVLLNVFVPFAWLAVPAGSGASLPTALLVSLASGAANNGWLIASGRLLYGRIIPPSRRTSYTSLHYAWMGVVGGAGPLLAGGLLDSPLFRRRWLLLPGDPYIVLLLVSAGLSVLALVVFRGVQGDSEVSFKRFLRMFVQGNPLLALQSSLRYSRAEDELAGVTATERLGQARSPLTEEELLDALDDPRYAMRMQAVIALGRSGSSPRVMGALLRTLVEEEGELRALAAWALGRQGDPAAAPALRAALAGDDARVRGQSARALGYLNDRGAIQLLLERLAAASSPDERLACAAALGRLDTGPAAPALLRLLEEMPGGRAGTEIALALARIVGREQGSPADAFDQHDGYFIRLWRAARVEPGTAYAQAVLALARRLRGLPAGEGPLPILLGASAEDFAAGDLAGGARRLADVLALVPARPLPPASAAVLRGCAPRLSAFDPECPAYLLLTLHTLDATLPTFGARLSARVKAL